jgi:hypothetical protein
MNLRTWLDEHYPGMAIDDVIRQRHVELFPDGCPTRRWCDLHNPEPEPLPEGSIAVEGSDLG